MAELISDDDVRILQAIIPALQEGNLTPEDIERLKSLRDRLTQVLEMQVLSMPVEVEEAVERLEVSKLFNQAMAVFEGANILESREEAPSFNDFVRAFDPEMWAKIERLQDLHAIMIPPGLSYGDVVNLLRRKERPVNVDRNYEFPASQTPNDWQMYFIGIDQSFSTRVATQASIDSLQKCIGEVNRYNEAHHFAGMDRYLDSLVRLQDPNHANNKFSLLDKDALTNQNTVALAHQDNTALNYTVKNPRIYKDDVVVYSAVKGKMPVK